MIKRLKHPVEANWNVNEIIPVSSQNCFWVETVCSASDLVMENDAGEEKCCDGPTAVDHVKQPVSAAPFRYTKVMRIVEDWYWMQSFPTQLTYANIYRRSFWK